MKKKAYIVTLLAVCLLGAGFTASAQVWEIAQEDNYSIIRKVNDTARLAYSEGGEEKPNGFYLIRSSSTSAPWLKFHLDSNVYVKDFEIFHDSVFFCGTRIINNANYAAFGYFPLAGFPNCTVRLDTISVLKSFNRLAVYSVGGYKHVAVTASYHNNDGTMAEIRWLGSNTWEYDIANRYGTKDLFDDVAVTSSHVVFTSRYQKSSKYNYTRIWFLTKPAYGAGSLFLAAATVKELTKNTLGPVLCHDDDYLLVTANKTLNDTIFLSQFGGLYYYSTAYFKGIAPFTLRDLRIDMLTTHYDLLATTQTTSSTDSYIYHVREDLFTTGGSMAAHYYSNENINSLDRLTPFYGNFVASGHSSLYNTFRIYYYSPTNWVCSTSKTYSCNPTEYFYRPDQINILVSNYQDVIPVHSTSSSAMPIDIICN